MKLNTKTSAGKIARINSYQTTSPRYKRIVLLQRIRVNTKDYHISLLRWITVVPIRAWHFARSSVKPALMLFYSTYKYVVKCLQHIRNQNFAKSTSEEWSWDRLKSPHRAFGFHDVLLWVGNICFCKVCPRYNKASIKLQKRDNGFVTACKLYEEYVDTG